MADRYTYKVRNRSGMLVTGSLMADGQGLALQRLRDQGLTPIEVYREKRGLNIELSKQRVKLKEIAVFSRQFATMINSGLPILRALAILAEQTSNRQLALVLTAVRYDVEQGSSLSAAMKHHPKVFKDLFISMVTSGETGGSLDIVLIRLAEMLETEVKLRGKIKSAMTYPIAVVGLVFLIMAAMLLFVVPQFATIYDSLGGTLPLPTRVLLGLSNIFKHDILYLVAGLFIGRFVFRRWKATPAGRQMVDSVKLRVPVFGTLFHKTALARFSSTLSMLLGAGVPILQALDIVSDTVNNRVISKAVVDVQDSVREGESMAQPLGKHTVFPSMVVQMIAVGEETGQVDVMLAKVSEFYNQEVEAAVDSLTSLIEPLLIAVVGGAVGASVIALYMPMFNIIKLIPSS
jgi:type IV pilus assembly protein PilC